MCNICCNIVTRVVYFDNTQHMLLIVVILAHTFFLLIVM
jgi:hypothetical protein